MNIYRFLWNTNVWQVFRCNRALVVVSVDNFPSLALRVTDHVSESPSNVGCLKISLSPFYLKNVFTRIKIFESYAFLFVCIDMLVGGCSERLLRLGASRSEISDLTIVVYRDNVTCCFSII